MPAKWSSQSLLSFMIQNKSIRHASSASQRRTRMCIRTSDSEAFAAFVSYQFAPALITEVDAITCCHEDHSSSDVSALSCNMQLLLLYCLRLNGQSSSPHNSSVVGVRECYSLHETPYLVSNWSYSACLVGHGGEPYFRLHKLEEICDNSRPDYAPKLFMHGTSPPLLLCITNVDSMYAARVHISPHVEHTTAPIPALNKLRISVMWEADSLAIPHLSCSA